MITTSPAFKGERWLSGLRLVVSKHRAKDSWDAWKEEAVAQPAAKCSAGVACFKVCGPAGGGGVRVEAEYDASPSPRRLEKQVTVTAVAKPCS